MSLHRQISNLDEVSESVDEMSFSPAFSDEPDFIDELICELALVEDEVTSRPTSSDSWTTNPSPTCSTDSETSEVISSYEDVDAVISAVCRGFLFPDGMESEDSGEEDEDLTCRALSTISEESLAYTSSWCSSPDSDRSTSSPEVPRPGSRSSSSSTTTAINKTAEVLISQVLDETVKTLQFTKAAELLISQVLDNAVNTLQSTEEVRPLDCTEEVKTPETPQSTPDPGVTQPELVDHTRKEKKLKTFSLRRSRKIQPAPLDPSKEAESEASVPKQTKTKKVNRLSRFFHDLFSKAKRRFSGNSVRPL